MTPQGLAGRVIDVGRRSARVLLITDFNSRIPVVVERSGDHAILEGDNTAEPGCASCRSSPPSRSATACSPRAAAACCRPGWRSGRSAPSATGQPRCAPLVDWARLDYLSLLHSCRPAGGRSRCR